MGKLSGKRALVTGASSGIGQEIARELARHGADLIVVARREERLQALAKELTEKHGVDVRVHAADLGKPASAPPLFEATEGAGVPVDLLINNAGIAVYEDFLSVPWERQEAVLQLNLISLTQMTRLFAPAMVGRGWGRIMNVSSISGYLPTPCFAVYGAGKSYVMNFTETIDYEMRGTGVRAICVSPGGTWTEFSDHGNQKMKSAGKLFMMSAERCAKIAVKKMLRGRRNVVTGFSNAFGMFLLRFIPRALYPRVASLSMGMAVAKADEFAGQKAAAGSS